MYTADQGRSWWKLYTQCTHFAHSVHTVYAVHILYTAYKIAFVIQERQLLHTSTALCDPFTISFLLFDDLKTHIFILELRSLKKFKFKELFYEEEKTYPRVSFGFQTIKTWYLLVYNRAIRLCNMCPHPTKVRSYYLIYKLERLCQCVAGEAFLRLCQNHLVAGGKSYWSKYN